MKSLLSILSLYAILFMVSCSRTTEEPIVEPTEVQNLVKIKDISNDTHSIELYSATGTTSLGYNEIKFRIKNKATGQYEKNADVAWLPLMKMTSMSHACPRSAITKPSGDNLFYSGYIVFQMPQNESETWTLKFDYSLNGQAYTVTTPIDVPQSSKKTVSSFVGADSSRYIVALVEPRTPKVGQNAMMAGVWKMADMMTFPVVNGYTVKIDPRMPGMGNHSSPNNVHLSQEASGNFYTGKVSLTMTGYWKINLQLVNAENAVLKGEEVTAATPESSLYFELEF